MDFLEDKNIKEYNYYIDPDKDTYDWLEFNQTPEINRYPIADISKQMGNDPLKTFVAMSMNTDYLHFAAKNILNVNLLPFQLTILDTLWNKRLPLLIGSRGLGKSWLLAVYCLLRMLLHPGCKVVVVGAGLRQSKVVFDYMEAIWNKSAILQDVSKQYKVFGPKKEIDRYTFAIGESRCYACPLGDGQKIRGLRANYIVAEEFASIPEEVFNIVVQAFAIVQAEPYEKVKHYAMIERLKKEGVWNDQLEKEMNQNMGGNQIIHSGTAFFSFNHFYKKFKLWHTIISSRGDPNKIKELMGEDSEIIKGFDYRDYAILRIPYKALPAGMLDEGIIAQAKVSMSKPQFDMELGAVFSKDTNGFFKRSVLEKATTNKPIPLPGGEKVSFTAMKYGDPQKSYVMAIDPAAEQDNAAVVIVEMNIDHRKIVHCWTTNRKRHTELKKLASQQGTEPPDDYYKFIAKKIRALMRLFNIERIVMDKNGGGIAIMEALANKENCIGNEKPIYELIDEENLKFSDGQDGLHILQLLVPTLDYNAEANHGMLKDFQDRVLLFPRFDSIELARSIEIDLANMPEGQEHLPVDNYESLLDEIEELKNEITSIVVTPSSNLGKEKFDVPTIKGPNVQKGYLRKDRYSALLYANQYGRTRDKQDVFKIEYKAVGASTKQEGTVKPDKAKVNQMYYGPGTIKFRNNPNLNIGGNYYIKHKK